MTQKIIQIPTLNDTPEDFQQLFEMSNQVNGLFEDVRFDFSNCKFLRSNAVAFLGGLARLIESFGGSVIFDWDTLRSNSVRANLCQNGFAGNFGYNAKAWSGHSIPYREEMEPDMNKIMDYLTYRWIGKWVNVTDRLRDAISGRMWEIYSNAFEHSDTEVGVFTCGQHFRHRNDLILTVVDFGLGIPAKVKAFLSQFVDEARVSKLSGAECMKWAFERGNTTSMGGVARGLGLDLLKEFVRVNQGKLEVYSNDGYAIIDKEGERFDNSPISFQGTVVHITLRCDEKLYRFYDEAEE